MRLLIFVSLKSVVKIIDFEVLKITLNKFAVFQPILNLKVQNNIQPHLHEGFAPFKGLLWFISPEVRN